MVSTFDSVAEILWGDEHSSRVLSPGTLIVVPSITFESVQKSYGVTIEMKPLWLDSCVVIFISQDFTKRNLIFLDNFFFSSYHDGTPVSFSTQMTHCRQAHLPSDTRPKPPQGKQQQQCQ